MKRKFFNGFLLMALLVSSVSTFVSCKDYDEDMYVDLKSQLQGESTSLWDAVNAQRDALQGLRDSLHNAWFDLSKYGYLTDETLAELLSEGEDVQAISAKAAIAAMLQKGIDEAEKELRKEFSQDYVSNDSLAAMAFQFSTLIQELQAQINGLKDCACSGNTDIDVDSILKPVYDKVASLDSLIIGLPEKVDRALEQSNTAIAKAEFDSIRIDKLNAFVKDSVYTKDEINELLANLRVEDDKIDSIAKEVLNRMLADEESWFSGTEATIGELNRSIDAIWDVCEDLQDQLDEVNDRLDALTDHLDKMITSIIVQASKNPVVGYLNTPLGVTSNILAVYYGTAENEFQFPGTRKLYYATGEESLWNNRNIEIIGELNKVDGYVNKQAGAMLITAQNEKGEVEEGNAGTLYVTVNPNTVNFEGKTFGLVNSRDEDAPATLSELTKSDELLTFGYTRAANNGFYEAKATISEEQVANAKLNVNFADFKDEAVAMLKERSKSSVMAMGATIAQNIQNVAPAYALKGTWEDSDGEHSVYSNYGVAAVAVKPFSFNFAQDFSVNGKLPGIGQLQKIVGNMINKIQFNLNLPSAEDLDFEVKAIETGDFEFNKLKVKLTLRLDGDGDIPVIGKDGKFYTAYIEGGKLEKVVRNADKKELFPGRDDTVIEEEAGIKNEEIDGKMFLTCYYYFGNEIENMILDIVDQFNGNIENLADLLEEVRKLSEIQDSIDSAKNDIKDQINSYITKINNKLTQWINRAPAMLHLAMVAIDDNSKAGLLSQAQELPTSAKTTKLTLVPTSYSLEMLAPAYKKFVAVTDVIGEDLATAQTLAEKANQGKNMNKVVDSNVTCTLEGEKGKTYEVTYTAVDYAGKIAMRKYYVKF